MAADRTRYRLTGGIFLIATAIIVLPMLFDGAGVAPAGVPEMPPANETLSTPVVAPLQPRDLAAAVSLRQQLDDAAFDRTTSTRLGDPVLAPADGSSDRSLPQSWAIQVASFADRSNAVALRDQLRTDGYQAVLSDVKGLTGTATRVAIGPYIDRADATKVEHELEKRYGMDAIVVLFSR